MSRTQTQPQIQAFYEQRKQMFKEKETETKTQVQQIPTPNKTPKKYSEEWWSAKILSLYKGTDPFSKLAKIFQYGFVIIAEYNLMRYILRLLNGRNPSEKHLKHWYTRTRGTGSSISTVRMNLRLVIWINSMKFFTEQMRNKQNGSKQNKG